MAELDKDYLPEPETAVGRILRAARTHFFNTGFSAFTMDDLAEDLGMSKKTLYLHFPGKDAIIDTIIAHMGRRIASEMEAITSDRTLSFVEKLFAMVEVAGSRLAKVSPALLRDLKRFAPKTYDKIEALRQKNIPLYFGRLVRDGIASGMVRPEVDPDFAAQFWLQAIRGLIQPDVLERTQLSLRQTLENAIDLFVRGLLTPAGLTSYEKHLAQSARKRTAS